MSTLRSTLEAKPRTGSGKGIARRLRQQGLIPAVVYGRRLEAPEHIAVDPASIRKALATAQGLNTLIVLKIEGKGDQQVLLKDFQVDPVSRQMLHVDFLDVRENEPIKVKVPLVLVGRPVGVADGGILSQNRREIEVHALPSAIPEKIEADVSHLKIAQALHINDVKMPEGVKVLTRVNYTVAVVAVPEREEEKVAVAVEGAAAAAPGAAAPAAEGAAAAPGAAAPAAKGAAAPAAKKEEKGDKKK